MLRKGSEELAKCRSVTIISCIFKLIRLTAGIPVGRLGTPDEIAETVLWMVKTGYVNNKVVGVDGGIYAN